MSIQNEDWDPKTYAFRGYRVTHLPHRNLTSLGNDLPFEFVDYRANEEVPCYSYEKNMIACLNNYGFMTKEFLSNAQCVQSQQWFHTCVNNFDLINVHKKYWSHNMASSKETKPVLNISEVL